MTRRPLVGIHDFLNSRPILDPVRNGWVNAPFDLVTDTPSKLAERFHDGELDIALIPSVEYARNPDAVIIPVFCIASLGKVDTVLLFSRKPVNQIKSVCVDPKSRTSVAVMRILLKKLYDKDVKIITAKSSDPESMLKSASAGLLIGDSAFLVDQNKYIVHDLGQMWYRYSGLSFVHALLCSHRGKRWDEAITSLANAKRSGLARIERIVKTHSAMSKKPDNLLDYLTRRIHYDFDEAAERGLESFLNTALSMGLVKRADIELYK